MQWLKKLLSPLTPPPPPFLFCFLHFNFKEPGYQTVLHTHIYGCGDQTLHVLCISAVGCMKHGHYFWLRLFKLWTSPVAWPLALLSLWNLSRLWYIACQWYIYIQECNQKWNITDHEEFIFSLCTLNTLVKMLIFVCLAVFSSPHSIFMSICLWGMSGSICYTLKT